MREVVGAFLRLGLTSFGGPVAHLGTFRRELVERRGWVDEPAFAAIVAFCSVLPGPTSSQVGMLLGLVRAGPLGALGAWLGFTLPSALILGLLGALAGAASAARPPWFAGLAAGLEAAVAAVVALAVLGLAGALCPDRPTRTIALLAAAAAYALGASGWQWIVIALGAAAGVPLRRDAVAPRTPLRVPRALSVAGALVALASLLAIAVPVATPEGILVTTILRAGTLVFGGGHVVLPLLSTLVRDHVVAAPDFYAGYGAAQAVPGPLNAVAAFVGADNLSPLRGALGALVCTLLIFAPSFGLIFALLPAWDRLRRAPRAAGALAGANAAVVGLLAATGFVLARTALGDARDTAIGLLAFVALAVWNAPPWAVVLAAAAAGAAVGAFR